jgi:hypothetical protein
VLNKQLQAGALLKHEHQLQCPQTRLRAGIKMQLQRIRCSSHPQGQTAGRSALIKSHRPSIAAACGFEHLLLQPLRLISSDAANASGQAELGEWIDTTPEFGRQGL